mmetsp:Transcript_15895/g.36652  ORF Transcript_15895/g.36652 Transcript_15895/m.36652 type:complete len:174 (+) Transcript_15895:256-777(+)
MQRHRFFRGLFLMLNTYTLLAFHVSPRRIQSGSSKDSYRQSQTSALVVSASDNDNEQDIVPSSLSDEDKTWYADLRQRHEEIQVEQTRNSLEKQHTQYFLKKRPVKLPYEVARGWVQNNLGVSTKEEFEDFVAMGYVQTPYIPKYPEQYYTRTREWISWDHFLNDSVRRDAFD